MPLRTAPLPHVGVAVLLAFLAGMVDAVGFSRLGGLFVSFMSGNSTRLGVFLAGGDLQRAGQAAGLIACFVVGAGLGSVIASNTGRWRKPAVLISEAGLLATAAVAGDLGSDATGIALMAAAMGLENATFATNDGETRISLTFMTGALVKVGEGLAASLTGGPRWSWLPYGLLWMGLTTGALAGASSYGRFGLDTLYGVSAIIVLIAGGFGMTDRAR